MSQLTKRRSAIAAARMNRSIRDDALPAAQPWTDNARRTEHHDADEESLSWVEFWRTSARTYCQVIAFLGR
jgi:hypothetical protein